MRQVQRSPSPIDAVTEDGFFDLNVDTILQDWRPRDAVRELIANALDEQKLSGSAEVTITKRDGAWHVVDGGRGLRVAHLTQNESREKHQHADRVIGRFGVGLKDALARLHRDGVEVLIRSRHADLSLESRAKHGFDSVKTLHAAVRPPSHPKRAGTEVVLRGLPDAEMAAARGYFLQFNGDEALEETRYGQVLRSPRGGPSRIYVNGLLVAEDRRLALSYNITSLTKDMREALRRVKK